MQFDNVQQLLVMDGHGVYVWSAVFVSVCVLIGLIIRPLRQHRRAIKKIARELNPKKTGKLTGNSQEASDASNT